MIFYLKNIDQHDAENDAQHLICLKNIDRLAAVTETVIILFSGNSSFR